MRIVLSSVAVLALVTFGCGDSDSGGGESSGGSGGATGGTAGTGGGAGSGGAAGSGASGGSGGVAGGGGSGGVSGSGGVAGSGGGGTVTAKQVDGGSDFTCAVLSSGGLKCWGVETSGRLGNGASETLGDDANETPDQIPATNLGSAKVLSVALGNEHACAVLEGGKVKCWGEAGGGRLGLGDTVDQGGSTADMGDKLPFVDLGSGVVVSKLSAGGGHTCALTNDGKLKCWGNGGLGQLGNGKADDIGDGPNEMGANLPFADVGGKVTDVACGGSFTCALLDDGSVKCFGRGAQGQLGNEFPLDVGDAAAEMGSALVAVKLGTGVKAKSIGAGDLHACAVTTDGKVKCWGSSNFGALGYGDKVDHGDTAGSMGDALQYVDLAGATATALALGKGNSCALLTGGKLRCWGSGSDGENGNGKPDNLGNLTGQMGSALPDIDLGSGVIAATIASGSYFNCAIDTQSRLKCWGDNINGQLGLGHANDLGNDAGEMGDALPFVKF